jgi:hypothetical protein
MGIKEEITKIAVEQGYEGAKPKSIAQAIDALADTLAGEDVTGSRSIAGAIHALAPYIGSSGGGGAELGAGYELTVTGDDHYIIASDQPMTIGEQGPEGVKLYMLCKSYQNFPGAKKPMMPAGMHVMLSASNAKELPTYTVQGVEYESVIDGYGIQFVMPENAVSIGVNVGVDPLE